MQVELIVVLNAEQMENKTYKVYTNAFYGYYHPEDIEVKKKSDIEDYIEYLKRNGFTGME